MLDGSSVCNWDVEEITKGLVPEKNLKILGMSCIFMVYDLCTAATPYFTRVTEARKGKSSFAKIS